MALTHQPPFDKGATPESSEEGLALGWRAAPSASAPLVPGQPDDLAWSPRGRRRPLPREDNGESSVLLQRYLETYQERHWQEGLLLSPQPNFVPSDLMQDGPWPGME